MRRAVDGAPYISSVHGEKTSMGMYGKHLGYDYVGDNRIVRAPEGLVITGLFSGGGGGNYIEANSMRGTRTHRFLHLRRNSLFSTFKVKVDQLVPEGAEIGRSGRTGIVTGAHLHHDVRKKGTAWNSNFGNYIDWEKLIVPALAPPTSKMPRIGSRIQLIKGFDRNTFRAGTQTKAGKLVVKDNTYIYTIRAYDPRYPYRILINSKSAGGDGVALALFYTSGAIIKGWKQI